MGYDVIIIGAGAGGGIIAGVLCELGKRVLLLERGQSQTFEQTGRDHLRNQRLSQYGNNAGPNGPGMARVAVDWKTGEARVVLPHGGAYSNNAAVVGGGTRVYGAQAWRFHPDDFRMASIYGVPENSSLADWPIGYEDLAPFYEQAEWELGVAADHSQMTHLPAYAKPYPMPPMVLNTQGRTLRAGAQNLGWDTLSVPLAINTVPYNGRAACIHCQHCVGFACPTDAKNGSQNTLIPRALQTGRCDLATGATAAKIETGSDKQTVTGVSFFDETGAYQTVNADVVVVAGGAVETARLLLMSGLGGKVVGQNLQGHYYPGANGLLPHEIWDGVGPGVTTATVRFNHQNSDEAGEIIGGGMLADEFIALPATVWKQNVPPDVPRWGMPAKNWMRDNFRRVTRVTGPVQEIPTSDARVVLDPDVTDKWGLPVARLEGAVHEDTLRTSVFMHARAVEWLRASGAVKIWGNPPSRYLSGGQHQAGTCRMGHDPQTSVVDSNCRVHGHTNLFLGDGSVHVTNGGFNPFLTISALAFRTALHIAQKW